MGGFSNTGRCTAALVALCAWAGLLLQFEASLARTGSVGTAAWVMIRYFTVITNLVVAVVFTGIAGGRRETSGPSLLGGVTLAIVLVGVVYGLLLTGLVELSGGAKTADVLLHRVTPVLAPLFWLVFAPKGGLRPRDPWVWALFPLAYFIYALARGQIEGVYAYPFIDVGRLGWARTGANAAAIALGFVAAGHIARWIDGRFCGKPEPA